MLVSGALIFTSDAERLVLKPIERMMNMVEAVAANPLAPTASDNTALVPTGAGNGGKKRAQEGDYETKLLESTIEKITGLLRVGFGEAGAGIISANLSTSNKSMMIDPLLPGVRVYAIFGFCDIHHFEDSKYPSFTMISTSNSNLCQPLVMFSQPKARERRVDIRQYHR